MRFSVVPGGNHEVGRLIEGVLCLDLPVVIRIVRRDYLLTKPGRQVEVPSIRLQVVNDLQARRISRVSFWKGHEGELRVRFIGMQVKPVIIPAPGRSHFIALLQE